MAGILIMTDWKAPKHTMAWWDNLYTTLVQAAKDADDTPGVSVIDDSFDERPIPFNAEMVRAILDGRKSQTRRVVNPQPERWIDKYVPSASPEHWLPQGVYIRDPAGALGRGPIEVRRNAPPVRCPYGKPGDRLWVKETWQHLHNDGSPLERLHDWEKTPVHCFYRADESDPTALPVSGKWRPSIHMPRWASRITLEITEVRAERVQEISEDDANAEGCGLGCTVKSERFGRYMSAGQYAFAELWDSINAKRGLGWEANPWVWVIGFRKLERAE
jgi:hypothetical protein